MGMAVNWFLWFITYSFIGWVYESVVCSIGGGKPVNRGFLNGPVCPVYGFGAIVSILFLYGQADDIFMLFFAGTILTCTVEYITSVLLEKLFNARWWDYSSHHFHINGRVSLRGAVVFGILSVLLVKLVHPIIVNLTELVPDAIQIILASVILAMITIDSCVTIRHLLSLNGRLQEIQTAMNEYLEEQTKRAEEIKGLLLERFEESEFYSERIKSLINANRIQNIRLAKAFPKLRSIKYEDAWERIRARLLK